MQLDEMMHQMDMADRCFAVMRLKKLSVAELRALLIHYKLARNEREAREWPKDEMACELADIIVADGR
jgi:hypothetical protein